MPPSDVHGAPVNQGPPNLDLVKFARIVGMLGSSHEGERSNAVTLGGCMLQAAGMRWEDFIEAYRRAEIATETARILLSENEQLKTEVERLRIHSGVAEWSTARTPGAASEIAEWALDLHRRRRVKLNRFELEFLGSCATWEGKLTDRMKPIFGRIIGEVVRITKETPP